MHARDPLLTHSHTKPNGAFIALSYGSKDKGCKTCLVIFINLPQIPRTFMRKTREGNSTGEAQTLEVGQDDDRLLAESPRHLLTLL